MGPRGHGSIQVSVYVRAQLRKIFEISTLKISTMSHGALEPLSHTAMELWGHGAIQVHVHVHDLENFSKF